MSESSLQRESIRATREYIKQLRIRNLIDFANWSTSVGSSTLKASPKAQQEAFVEVSRLLLEEDFDA